MKMTKLRKSALCVLLLLCLLFGAVSCGTSGEAEKISFKETLSYETLKSLAGTRVQINGFMATSSPVDGSFFFLMNLPYQSCPFCKPNTNELSNTIEVYPKKKARLTEVPTQAIKVTGRLEVAPEGEPFSDSFGYEFSFKIVDAEYSVLTDAELSENMALWQKIADSGLVDQMYNMFNYVHFTCAWPTYYGKDRSGKPFYLYPADAERFLKEKDGQYNYGYKDDYFDRVSDIAKALDAEELKKITDIIAELQSLSKEALLQLDSGAYTSEKKTFTVDGVTATDTVYTLLRGDDLVFRYEKLYERFSEWLSGWEF